MNMHFSAFILLVFVTAASVVSSASIQLNSQLSGTRTRVVTSPHTLKTYHLFNSNSGTSFSVAQLTCPSGTRLASIHPDSGDIDFLGQYIESLEHPYWIDGSVGFNTPVPCAALYAGGAVAIPKPTSPADSPCDSQMNFICEVIESEN